MASNPVSLRHQESQNTLPLLGLNNWSALDDIGRMDLSMLHDSYRNADPFPHLVLDGLFDADFLAMVENDFNVIDSASWRESRHRFQRKRGTVPDVVLPKASRHYFDQLASAPMLRFLSAVSGIKDLKADPTLYNGGLHQVPNGGCFELHVDFAFHPENRLKTRLVVITYLNNGWLADWGGGLELWSWRPRERHLSILPEFGRTLIMDVGPRNVHGHPHPIQTPDGRPRRSAASYFYTDRAPEDRTADVTGYVDRPDASINQRAIRLVHSKMPVGLARRARQIFGRR